MITIKLLPLDERPCNIKFAEKLCQVRDEIKLICPEPKIYGQKKQAADLDSITNFSISNNQVVDYFVVSLDMFLYGGLLPSRLHQKSFEQICERLELLKKIKQTNPQLKIYAFSTIMRTPSYNSCDEEPEYYQDYGQAIFTKKFLEDKQDMIGLSDVEASTLAKVNLPKAIETDYATRRSVNLRVNLKIIDYLEQAIFDYLIFPQDDSAQFGYTRIDQAQVYSRLASFTKERYSVHPGADEVALTMIARIVNQSQLEQPKVYIELSSESRKKLIPKYEDRALEQTLELHLIASGFKQVSEINQATHYLFYNVPQTSKMFESVEQNEFESVDLDLSYFQDNKGYILDCAYANGGDFKLIKQLRDKNLFGNVLGYSGWNTNANSLGTILCTMAIVGTNENSQSQKFVVERLIEDVFYQAKIRKQITDNLLEPLGLNYFDLKTKQAEVVKTEEKLLIELGKSYLPKAIFSKYQLKISHPWNRMFEIDLDLLDNENK
ncbi:MAG: DUF4127 family protein [Mycoplasmatales bacterium]